MIIAARQSRPQALPSFSMLHAETLKRSGSLGTRLAARLVTATSEFKQQERGDNMQLYYTCYADCND